MYQLCTVHTNVCTTSRELIIIIISQFELLKPQIECCVVVIVTDTDECAMMNGGCEEVCYNFKGGFSCDCPEGYQLQNNFDSCKGMFHEPNTLDYPELILQHTMRAHNML